MLKEGDKEQIQGGVKYSGSYSSYSGANNEDLLGDQYFIFIRNLFLYLEFCSAVSCCLDILQN